MALQFIKTVNMGTVNDNMGDVQAQIISLITSHILGFSGVYKTTITPDDITFQFPALQVVPIRTQAEMVTTGKYLDKYFLFIRWYFKGNDRTNIKKTVTEVGEAVEKLFSNNADGLLDGLYKQNPPYWFNCEFQQMPYSGNVRLAQRNNEQDAYARVGTCSMVFYKEVIK